MREEIGYNQTSNAHWTSALVKDRICINCMLFLCICYEAAQATERYTLQRIKIDLVYQELTNNVMAVYYVMCIYVQSAPPVVEPTLTPEMAYCCFQKSFSLWWEFLLWWSPHLGYSSNRPTITNCHWIETFSQSSKGCEVHSKVLLLLFLPMQGKIESLTLISERRLAVTTSCNPLLKNPLENPSS